MTEIDRLVRTIVEFYQTGSGELASTLECYRQNDDAWRMSIVLMDASRPGIVQFYGAELLYHSIAKNFTSISDSMENTTFVKNFLLQKLSTCAHSLPHSVLNKLSSGLALFLLKSMPDLWPGPLKELMLLWGNQLELLLTVLAEIPSEFQRLNLSLEHRNRVRTELQNTTKEVVQIAQHVLEDTDSPGSIRTASLECIESWIKLAGTNLLDFVPVFNAVFTNIGNDFMALASIIGTIKSSDELRSLPRLVWQIFQVFAGSVCPLVQAELGTIMADDAVNGGSAGERMEDLVPLVCTIVEFSREYAKILVDQVCRHFADQAVLGVYLSLCHFFLQVSNLPGLYPLQECLSDLPEAWWLSLREELLQPDEGSTWSEGKRRLREESQQWYLQMLEAVIRKFTCPEEPNALDKLAMEAFERYRLARSDCSQNAVQMAPEETIALLAGNLHSALDAYDLDRSEAVIYLIKEAADFLKESQMDRLVPALLKCGTVEEWSGAGVSAERMARFGRTFLQFVKATEHHLLRSPRAEQLLPALVQIVLSYLNSPKLSGMALETLLVVLKSRESSLLLAIDPIIQGAYHFFANSDQPEEVRLLAIRCVGMGLSFKDGQTINESLNQILAPRLAELDRLATAVEEGGGEVERINFELGVLAQLVATLEVSPAKEQPQAAATGQASSSSPLESPVKIILDKALPLFNRLLGSQQRPRGELIPRVCDVLKAGLQSLYTDIAPLLEAYLLFLDAVIQASPEAACELAKKIFLTFHKESALVTPTLVNHLSRWFSTRSSSIAQQKLPHFPEELDEKLVELAHHVVKKFWSSLLFATHHSQAAAANVAEFVQSLCFILAGVVERSRDTSLVLEALRTLNLLMKTFASSDNPVLAGSVESGAERVITALFLSIRSESTMPASLNLIADILHLFAGKYPAQTRNIIRRLPGGDGQLIEAMFSTHSTKNFRLRVLQIHQAFMQQRA